MVDFIFITLIILVCAAGLKSCDMEQKQVDAIKRECIDQDKTPVYLDKHQDLPICVKINK